MSGRRWLVTRSRIYRKIYGINDLDVALPEYLCVEVSIDRALFIGTVMSTWGPLKHATVFRRRLDAIAAALEHGGKITHIDRKALLEFGVASGRRVS